MKTPKNIFGYKKTDAVKAVDSDKITKHHKKKVILLASILLIFIVGTSAFIFNYINTKKHTKTSTSTAQTEAQKNAQNLNTKVADTQKNAANSDPASTATAQEKEQHYTEALLYFLSANNKQGASDYYVQKILPSGVKITRLDIYDSLALAMKGTGHDAELKNLLDEIISNYKALRVKTASPELAKGIDQIISDYTKQRNTL